MREVSERESGHERRRELLVMRHAKSDRRLPLEDFDRPLTARGKRACKRVGAWIASQGLVPDHVLASPAVRARDTAHRTLRAMGQSPDAVVAEPRIYEASVETLLEVLAEVDPGCTRVLLIGHNPGLEDLVRHLAAGLAEPAGGKLLPTAAVCRLRLPCDWRSLPAACGEVRALVRPRALAEK